MLSLVWTYVPSPSTAAPVHCHPRRATVQNHLTWGYCLSRLDHASTPPPTAGWAFVTFLCMGARIYTRFGVGPWSLNVLQLVSELKSVKSLSSSSSRPLSFSGSSSVLYNTPFFSLNFVSALVRPTACLLLHSVLFHLSLQWDVARPAAICLIKMSGWWSGWRSKMVVFWWKHI